MTEPLIVVEEHGVLAAHFGQAKPISASSPMELQAAMSSFIHGAICVGRSTLVTKWLASLRPRSKTPHRLLLLGAARGPERAFLRAVFESVVVPHDEMHLLELDDLFEVLCSPQRAHLFIGGAVALAAKSVVLIRGDLDSLVIPFSWFTSRPKGPRPDFSDFEVIDSGQTIRLGHYEAAGDAVFYELDPEYRRRERKRRIAEDKSLGGALRRLRLQRGLGRDAFSGITAKTIARIERGEVRAPHADTLAVIAEKLGVEPMELATF